MEAISWSDVLRVQGLYALGVLALVAAGAALAGPAAVAFVGGSAPVGPWFVPAAATGVVLLIASLVVAASRSDYELPVIRALLAAGALVVVWGVNWLGLGLPFVFGWGLGFALALRVPDDRAWVARGAVLLVAGIVVPPLALLLTPLAVRASDDLALRF